MISDANLQNRSVGGYVCHAPRLMSAHAVSKLVGTSYFKLLRMIAAGRVRPDATNCTGGVFFHEDRLPELKEALQ